MALKIISKKSTKGDEFFNLFVNGKNSASPKSIESDKEPNWFVIYINVNEFLSKSVYSTIWAVISVDTASHMLGCGSISIMHKSSCTEGPINADSFDRNVMPYNQYQLSTGIHYWPISCFCIELSGDETARLQSHTAVDAQIIIAIWVQILHMTVGQVMVI